MKAPGELMDCLGVKLGIFVQILVWLVSAKMHCLLQVGPCQSKGDNFPRGGRGEKFLPWWLVMRLYNMGSWRCVVITQSWVPSAWQIFNSLTSWAGGNVEGTDFFLLVTPVIWSKASPCLGRRGQGSVIGGRKVRCHRRPQQQAATWAVGFHDLKVWKLYYTHWLLCFSENILLLAGACLVTDV